MNEVEMTESVIEVPAVVAPQNQLNNDPDLLDKIFERFTRTGQEALRDKPLIATRVTTFVVDGSICEPDTFVNNDGVPYDFQLTMRALNAEEELRALTQSPPGHAVPMFLAKCMLFQLNGKTISEGRRENIWNMLGMAGRSLCFQGYLRLSGPSVAALGKFQESFSIGSV